MLQYIQIIAVVIVFTIYVYGLFKVVKITRVNSPNKWWIVAGFTTATLILIYLILNIYKIGPADFVQIMLTFGLVLATTLYAISTAKMVEEMREQRLNMDKPIILLDTQGGSTRGKYFVKAIKIGFRNEGRGSALNLELSIDHSIYSFNKYRHLVPVDVERNDCNLRVEKPDPDDDPQVSIPLEVLAIANYDDVSGNYWHSTLGLLIAGDTQDIQPGHMQVGVAGHRNTGVKPK